MSSVEGWGSLQELLLSPWVLGLLGLCIGSFLNVVIHRLPLMMDRQWKQECADMLGTPPPPQDQALNLVTPPSRCPHCGHTIRWYENIPLVSWAFLKGRCASCGQGIAWRYPLIELSTGLLFALVAWVMGPTTLALLWCGVAAALLAAAAIDWDTTYLPDSITLPLLWAGLIAASMGWSRLSLDTALWGAVAGYLSLWSVYWLFKLTTGKEGMGYGDFKLLAALGAWLGATAVLPILIASSVIGLVVGLALRMRSQLREGQYVPFGPFLAGAGLSVALLSPQRVLQWLGWY